MTAEAFSGSAISLLGLYLLDAIAVTDSSECRRLHDCALATERTAPSKRQWGSRRSAVTTCIGMLHRNPSLPLHTRIRAAMSCLKHEHPTLGIQMLVDNQQDFAQLLDTRIARLKQMEAAKLIEAKPQPQRVEHKPPPRIVD